MKGIILAAALGAGLAISTAAHAADLGGNCCADLEERISELEATTARKSNRKVMLTVYGEVNQGIIWVDDGDDSDWVVGNNQNSTSRFGFRGEAKFGQGWAAGYVLEIGVGGFSDSGPANNLSVRHSTVYLTSPVGTVWLGQTSTATDGIAEGTVANTAVAAKLLSFLYLGDTELGDGIRDRVVKWESPALAGFVVSASANSGGDAWSAALRWSGEGGGFKGTFGLGYDSDPVLDLDWWGGPVVVGDKRIAGSVSVMHLTSGLFANIAAAQIEAFGQQARAYHGQAGVEQKFFAVGKTTLYGEFLRYDIDVLGTADVWGAGIVQNVEGAALDLYLGARHSTDMDMKTVLGGARIKF